MTKFFYFKMTFLSVAAGLFAGLLVYGLFDENFSIEENLTGLLLKSAAVAVTVGLLLGVLNMYFKIGNFQKKTK